MPPHQRRGRERENQRERITVWPEIWLCIKAKLRGKGFLLNWLYIHQKKTTMSPSPLMRFWVFVCLLVPFVYTLPVSTFTHCYQSPFCGIKSRFPLGFFPLALFLAQRRVLFTLRRPTPCFFTHDDSQVLHLAGWSGGLSHAEPDLTYFPFNSSWLAPYLWASAVSLLGNRDIFSSLEVLAGHSRVAIQAPTVFLLFSITQRPFYVYLNTHTHIYTYIYT